MSSYLWGSKQLYWVIIIRGDGWGMSGKEITSGERFSVWVKRELHCFTSLITLAESSRIIQAHSYSSSIWTLAVHQGPRLLSVRSLFKNLPLHRSLGQIWRKLVSRNNILLYINKSADHYRAKTTTFSLAGDSRTLAYVSKSVCSTSIKLPVRSQSAG